MAESHQSSVSLTDNLQCPICLSLLSDASTLDCGHSFCRSCVAMYWDSQQTPRLSCPECRQVFPDRNTKVVYALRRAVEHVRRARAPKPATPPSGDRCPRHGERFSHFWEAERAPLCRGCLGETAQPQGAVRSIADAVAFHKDALKGLLSELEESERRLTEVQLKQKHNIAKVQETFVARLNHVKQCFTEMGKFMQRTEQGLIEKLEARAENTMKEMEVRLKEIQEALASVAAEMAKRKEAMEEEDDLKFLQGLSSLKPRTAEDIKALEDTSEDPSLEILNGPLQYSVWQELGKVIKPGPTSLMLDPDTANPWLRLTPDLTGVQWAPQKRSVPDGDLGRYDLCPCVLASSGFDSGRHYWEVRVAGCASWTLGVASGRAPRRGDILLSPPNGYWTLGLREGSQYRAFSVPLSDLWPPFRPQVIGVYLDYGGGQLSFYDANGLRHLHTFGGCTFEGKLYPFFSLGWDHQQHHAGANPSSSEPLQLLNPLAAPSPNEDKGRESCPCSESRAVDDATLPHVEGAHRCHHHPAGLGPSSLGPGAWLCLGALLALCVLAPGRLAESYLVCCGVMGLVAWSWSLLDRDGSPRAVEVCQVCCGALAYAGLWCLALAYARLLGACSLAVSLGGLMLIHRAHSGLALAPGTAALLGLLGLSDSEVWAWWTCCGLLGYAGLCLAVLGRRAQAELCWWCCGVQGYFGLCLLVLGAWPLAGVCWILLGIVGLALGMTGHFEIHWLWAGILSYCGAWCLLLADAALSAVALGTAGFIWSSWSHLPH
ncbi:nuclear factor 7, brain-like [Stegostoma tigrinum]|uniref:nuclear factor 7, brain-like n=1 Tax=Stegostoma tigrinum TaxID=3053191 RepID=UPI002870ACD2|nr:nuclear factor 7, brain-like [Stegostoma tigrinum]